MPSPSRAPEAGAAGNMESIARWTVASLSFTAVLVLFIMMDFGDRGYHFDPARTYASKLSAGDEDGYDLTRLRLLQRCIGYIRANYVDPDRADADRMILASLADVERRVPEFMSDPVMEGDKVVGIRVRVGSDERVFDLARVDDLYTISWKLLDIFEYVTPLLSGTVEARDVEYAAVNGLLRTLDPHSILLTPSVYREMRLGTTGKFGGLGIVIAIQDGKLMVQSVMDGTPAQRAGLKSADKIIQINSESTVNMSLSDAVKRLRGAPGTPVDIWIMRKSFAEARKFRIVRSNITLASVTSRLLDGNVAYARIKNFQQSTGADLEKAMNRLEEQALRQGAAALTGVVLDLRDNPGGLLDQAIEVSDLFLKDGTIVTTVGSGQRVREERVASPNDTRADVPLVVLVNAGSASASEIVAGALRNNDRAAIVGSRTFGKGSVQVIYDIDDAALKLTIAQYLTPGDESIQSVGITPHVQLAPVTVGRDRVDLNLADHGGERSLKNHLVNAGRTRSHVPDARVAFLAKDEDTDFAVGLATRMVREAGNGSARQMLVSARSIFAEVEREQTAELVKALTRLDVDWHNGKAPRKPRIETRLSADADRVEAGQAISLELSVTNKGTRALHRVRALTESPEDAFDGRDFLLGRIPPGETRRWKVTVDVPRSIGSQAVPVTALVYVGDRLTSVDGANATARIDVQGLPRPRFAYTVQVLDSEHGNGDGILNTGERVKLRVRLENVGTGAALRTLAVLKNRGGDEAFITDGRAQLKGLAAGEARDVIFEVEMRENAPVNGPQLDLRVTDTVLRQTMTHSLNLPFTQTPADRRSVEIGRWIVGSAPLALHGGADAGTATIGHLAAESAIVTDARFGHWLRVPLVLEAGDDGLRDLFGWIEDSSVTRAEADRKVGQQAAWSPATQAQQPRIALTGNLSLETKDGSVRIAGQATFPTLPSGAHADVYIFRDSDKVYFVRGKGRAGESVEFDADITLEPGQNKIAIYARAGRDLLYKHRVTVYRR
ncbi:MAG: carboxyl-terminal processing protease [Myxococcota bacterium]|jgi:carboxyl-terminal processing protease